ncbi:MAG: ribonuclease Z [Chlamydiae bacterium]|nr:ribonuclease Z [Chlamydiota bacterium]
MSDKDVIILGTSSQQPTRKRSHGAYLIRWNEEGLLFDPGEGTQRQFIFANIAPTTVTRIFVSHFHGDHCLGLGSMLMRLNLDKVPHPVHCYFPRSGKKNFDALRYGCLYHQTIQIVEHPVTNEGIVEEDHIFKIEAAYLNHSVEAIGWRITEKDKIKFDSEKLKKLGVAGPNVSILEKKGSIQIQDKMIKLEEVSWVKKGESVAVVMDTLFCKNAIEIAKNCKVLICESTYLEEHKELAKEYMHMTAKEAAIIAKEANVELLILTHFSARYQDLSLFKKEAEAIFPNVIAAEDLQRIPFLK